MPLVPTDLLEPSDSLLPGANFAHIFEVSFDPLSDLTPTWTDLSSRLLEVPSVRVGVDDDLSEMQPGTGTFRLDNRDRALEPGYAAGAYYPNVRPLRRCRYLIDDGTTVWPQFYGYIVSWGPLWPGGMNQEAIIQAVDGSVILEMDTLPALDPPAASTYEEVVLHDQPFAFYTANDVDGTQMKAETGPDMVIVGRPLVQQPTLLTGDAGFSIRAGTDPATSQRFRAAIEAGQFGDTNKVSCGGWFKPLSTGGSRIWLRGPEVASSDNAFTLSQTGADKWQFQVVSAAGIPCTATGTTTISTARADMVVGTWDGQTARIYVNGVVEASQTVALTIGTGVAEINLYIGDATGTTPLLGYFQKVEFHETTLSPERVLARYEAGSGGFPAELAGERIAAVADSGLWAETDIDPGYHEVAPLMSHGQSRMEAIKDAVRAEFPMGLFYFPGTADPRYLDWDYGDTAPYNTPQVTIGNHGGGEVPFLDIDTTDEDELYNEVTVSREGGLAQTATDSASEGEFFRRTYSLTGLTHTMDMGCAEVAGAILAFHSQPDPPVRVKSVTLTSDNALALAEILERMPGDLIRVKHRPKGGTAIDIVTRIRGRTLSVAPLDGGNRVISCTWTLGRGFAAVPQYWHAGTVGFTEAGTTTKAK